MYQKNNIKFLSTSIFFSLLFLIVSLFFNYNVTSFSDRVIGEGMLNGVDVSKRVNSFYILLFVLIPACTIIILKILNKFLKNTNAIFIRDISVISSLGIISIVLAWANVINNSKLLLISVVILAGIDLLMIFANLFKEKVNIKELKWACIASIPIAFFVSLLSHRIANFFNKAQIIWVISYFIGVVILNFIINRLKNRENFKRAYTFFLMAPLLELIYLELYNILNQYNIILSNKIATICIIYLICFGVFLVYYFVNKKNTKFFNYTKYYYPVILLIFTFIIASLQMITNCEIEFFESANHGLGVYEFFRYGKVPIIETFDTHMFQNQLGGFIFEFLNHDLSASVFCLYNSYEIVLFYIVIYYFLKKIFSRDIAFLITFFLPLQYDNGLRMYYMAMLSIITLINACKNKDFKSFLWYWLSLIFLCIWRLDLGYACTISTVIVLIYIFIKNRKSMKIKNILMPLGISVLVCIIFFISVCLVKNINPIMRVIEFFKLSLSNVNWGYSFLGETDKLAYVVCYYIMPLTIVGTLIYNFYDTKGKIDNFNISLTVLALFIIFNFQRGVIRHSWAEGTIHYAICFTLLYLSLFIMKRKNNKLSIFIFVYIGLVLVNGLLLTPDTEVYTNLFERGIKKYTTFKVHDESYNEKVKRISLSNNIKNEYIGIKDVLTKILEEDETYIDFSNQSLLYALIDKEKPVYINQTPALLSGELTQQMYIEEIKKCGKKVPVLLKAKNKPNAETLDGIPNEYRYYLLSEFFYQNYEPVAEINEYEIWIEKETVDEKSSKLPDTAKRMEKENYINDVNVIGQVPFIWGQYDKSKKEKMQKEILQNTVVEKVKSINIENKDLNKTNGNYLKMQITSEKDTNMMIVLCSKDQAIASYYFDVKKGSNLYTIRISTAYGWYEQEIENIKIQTLDEIKIDKMMILEADTLREIM